ncbi:MAG: glycerol-3-phosphate 1-O-acyltransferase PlsY [Planctomycetota bacterium]
MDAAWGIAGAVAGYGVGSIPFGYLIARANGVDILRTGSGNIGATNVRRVVGRGPGTLCFALDVAKGLLPTLGTGVALGTLGRPDAPAIAAWLWLATPVACVLGHCASPWLGFRGGKGVATGLGGLLGIFWLLSAAVAGALVVWLVTLRLSRYVGLASVLAAVSVPICTLLMLAIATDEPSTGWAPYLAVTSVLAAFVVARHRGNLVRIAAGVEPRVGDPPPAGGPTPAEGSAE